MSLRKAHLALTLRQRRQPKGYFKLCAHSNQVWSHSLTISRQGLHISAWSHAERVMGAASYKRTPTNHLLARAPYGIGWLLQEADLIENVSVVLPCRNQSPTSLHLIYDTLILILDLTTALQSN
ncbi:uncharacterized protein BO96DRAFT_461200 [Aspergillus niger CBS 101883]|uniref:uncharacterized protein n=1 Tax=Aspergillus lacticoffeatus (strain CBS 101883) TaxID=1450533 RepID=UPI000D7F3DE4|nr:uncharacterized protein BO96DRAFT_461200 [Aspergillus niger CBS 101883]PYH61689.1 hypothetical protein BO96DRAFT_461200 [Aspergillus niger CBS 101883]